MKIQHSELKGRSPFALCRELALSGYPADELLEIYRGDTLAYKITSIRWGAEHKVREDALIGPIIVKYHPLPEKFRK